MSTKAPAQLRFLICALLTGTGDPNSLANVNTSELPDGACAWVISANSLFVLDKTSTATPVTGQVLAPGAGPGRWFRVVTAAAKGSPVWLQSSGSNSFAVPDGNWGQPTTNSFTMTALADWELTAAGGILTYSGEGRDFMAILTASAQISNGTTRLIYAGISKNNDLTGAAAAGTFGSQSTGAPAVDTPYSIVAQRRLSLVATDTVRVEMAATSGAATLAASALTLSLIPL